jgi:hypothetical protein
MNVLLSACEASSDLHAALVAQALVDLKPTDQELKIWGIGGDQLSQVREFECLIPSRHLLSMGFFAVLAKLPMIHRSLKIMSHEAQLRKPQVAIVFDYPDFHFKLAKALNRLNIPCVDMIPPKVWVWRKSRLKVMKVIFDAVISIFPFERSLYDKAQIKNVYFGNPLIEKLPRNIQNTRDKNEMIALSRASLRELGFLHAFRRRVDRRDLALPDIATPDIRLFTRPRLPFALFGVVAAHLVGVVVDSVLLQDNRDNSNGTSCSCHNDAPPAHVDGDGGVSRVALSALPSGQQHRCGVDLVCRPLYCLDVLRPQSH